MGFWFIAIAIAAAVTYVASKAGPDTVIDAEKVIMPSEPLGWKAILVLGIIGIIILVIVMKKFVGGG